MGQYAKKFHYHDNGTFWRTAPSDAKGGQVLAKLALSRGIESIAVTYTNNDYGKGLAEVFEASNTSAKPFP